jgi:hypothetical protein
MGAVLSGCGAAGLFSEVQQPFVTDLVDDKL